MALIVAQGLGRQFGSVPLFSGVSFQVGRGDRVGLIGRNGTGKTTLLRILAGLDRPDQGAVVVQRGASVRLLEQEPGLEPQKSLYDQARAALAPLQQMHDEMVAVARAMALEGDEAKRRRLAGSYDRLADRLRQLGAFQLGHRVEQVLAGVGFGPEQFHRPVGSFSGGEQCRLMLAMLLLAAPDVLLLDEPSNHLDLAGRQWLEGWLARLPQAMILVSHDRYLLDAVATRIFELEGGRLQLYTGNYSAYRRQKAAQVVVQQRTYARQQSYMARQREFIRRYQYGQRAAQAKDRAKKLARVQSQAEQKPVEDAGPDMAFGSARRAGDVVLEARSVSKSYGQTLFADLNLLVQRGDRVGIIGPNGSGKTTLLRMLIGRESPSSGLVRMGHGVVVGYFGQQLEGLEPGQTVLEAARPQGRPEVSSEQVRGLLARFGLGGEKVLQKIAGLSGGEKSRLALARLVLARPNLLALDEPTNHLDISAREALEQALLGFDGTTLIVSHDRFFLDRVVRRLIVLGQPKLRVFEGNYRQYRHQLEREAGQRRAPAPPTPGSRGRSEPRATGGHAAKRWKFPYRKVEDIEQEIERREAQLAELEARLADSRLYRDGAAVRSTRSDYEQLQQTLQRLYEHWEEALERTS